MFEHPAPDGSRPEGLLFYTSGVNGFDADIASGRGDTTFLSSVEIRPDPKLGQYFECGDRQRVAYKAPGNIYAQRGTLSFFWRSPCGPHRVSYLSGIFRGPFQLGTGLAAGGLQRTGL